MEEKENYFTCDYCHRVGSGITIVNGFKMCPMCLAEYQHKSGENNKLREELGIKHKEVEQLKKENKELKSEQNKVAVEKLEKLKVKLNEFKVDNFSDAYIVIKDMNFNISTMLAELKGGNDDKDKHP